MWRTFVDCGDDLFVDNFGGIGIGIGSHAFITLSSQGGDCLENMHIV